MAIDFTKLSNVTCVPNLPEGDYPGRFTEFRIGSSETNTPTGRVTHNVLFLTFAIPYRDFKINCVVRCQDYDKLLPTKTGGEFAPIANVLNPLRAQAKDDTLDLAAALAFAEANDVRLGWHRNEQGFLNLSVLYPERVVEDTTPEVSTATLLESADI